MRDAMTLRFETCPRSELPALDGFADATLFQTDEWLAFVADTQRGERVHARLYAEGRVVGRFAGIVVRRLGLRILGAPLPGWTTAYMGFNAEPGVDRLAALRALDRWALGDLRCVHYELMDRWIPLEAAADSTLDYRVLAGYEVTLSEPDAALLGRMSASCRRCIRKAERVGVTVREASPSTFAELYYAQLRDVFGKQGLAPTYSMDRVTALIRFLHDTGRLLLARADGADGRCLATGVFPAYGDTMYFWGGASWREHQILRPNEALQWFAMRYWRGRGVRRYDMGGGGSYKKKYGGADLRVPWFRHSRNRSLTVLRGAVQSAFRLRQRLSGLARRVRSSSD